MDGFFLVDKPKGITSQGVVNYIKKKFNFKKCGHNGTLDPDTTGLMVVGVNSATKLMKLINEHDKAYITTIRFGLDSDTLDISGNLTKEISMDFTEEALDVCLKNFIGKQKQVPPMVSAIKVSGKKLYQYQRENKEVEVQPRNVEIFSLKKLRNLRKVEDHWEVDLLLEVSKGFYVRSFARDLGKALGGCAIMKELRRIQSGNFTIEHSIPLKEIKETNLLKIEELFPFESIEVNDYMASLVKNGVILDERQIITQCPFYVKHQNKTIAIYEVIGENKYKPLVLLTKE